MEAHVRTAVISAAPSLCQGHSKTTHTMPMFCISTTKQYLLISSPNPKGSSLRLENSSGYPPLVRFTISQAGARHPDLNQYGCLPARLLS